MLHICLHLNTSVISLYQPETVYFRLQCYQLIIIWI